MIQVINGLVLIGNSILLVKKDNNLVLPGGKVHEGENYVGCLQRKFFEEFSGTKVYVGKYYSSFFRRNLNQGDFFETDVYFCKLIGKLGYASSKISSWNYYTLKELGGQKISHTTKEILEKLVLENYLK